MAQANVKLTVDATGATRALQNVQNKTNQLQSAFGSLRTAIGGIGIALMGKNALQTSASFEKLNVRLGLLTKASGTFAKSQQIAADAQKAFGLSATEALEGITDITARLAPLGVGVDDIKSTLDYCIAIQSLQRLSEQLKCSTIECFSEAILNCLEELYGPLPMTLILRKCHAPIPGFTGDVGIERSRNI